MAVRDDQLVTDMLEAFNERRWSEFAGGYADDAVLVYPQSGERFVGRDNIRGLVEAFPSPPTFAVTDVRSADGLVVVQADVDYGQGDPWKGVFLYTVTAGRVTAETAYFAGPFEPAGWRAPFRES